jgi:hypothetical protein
MKQLLLILFITTFLHAQDSIKIMYLGDSYTIGDLCAGARPYIDSIIQANGCNVKYIGRYNADKGSQYFCDTPGNDYSTNYLNFDWPLVKRNHEGVGGKQAHQWATSGNEDVTTAVTINTPDVLSIYIGINDIANRTRTAIMMRNDVDTMLCMAWRVNPNMRIILCNLAKTPITVWWDSINTYNALLPGLTAKYSSTHWIKLVDIDTALNETTDFASDNVHPSSSYGTTRCTGGYRHMAFAEAPIIIEAINYRKACAVELSEFKATVSKSDCLLKQSYPNPFNQSTSIFFSLPSKSFVSLKIFDLIGREVATIVSEEMLAGNYTRQWNADKFTSGVYFYRLQTRTFIETNRLVLLR